jgi:ribosomal protein S18 acetylase RimI-like enzyme
LIGRFQTRPVRSDEDIAAVARLFQAYAESLDVDLAYQDFATELASLPGKFAPPDGEMLLALEDGEPVGCVALRPLDQDGICEMKRLYVAPAMRGSGLGKALVERLIEEARSRGYRQMRLDTLPSMAAAQAMYRAMGFEPVEPYYDTPVEGTVFLGLRLSA